MKFLDRRNRLFDMMEEKSLLILFSGIDVNVAVDEYYPFESNRNFFYLTGLRRDNMVLILDKAAEKPKATLLIEEADPTKERWRGKKVTVEEAKEISGIEDVQFIDAYASLVSRLVAREPVETVYFDTHRLQMEDLETYNLAKAREFARLYPAVRVKNLDPLAAGMRMQKDEDEIREIRKAIELTGEGLKNVLRNLKPGMFEYQAQADFEYSIRRNGAERTAFSTIAGSGMNGTMLHYGTNHCVCEDGTLLLLDLGAKYKGYCADITRTYPVNGKFSERQRAVYEIVLKANRAVAGAAKPGVTQRELNDLAKKVLAEGCIGLGLISSEEEIGKYYMHGVSHHLGLDVHDDTAPGVSKLAPGAVITDEPGLYIDEWAIGIRIEDDLLITEDGCEVLSEDVMRDPDEIEAFMAAERR